VIINGFNLIDGIDGLASGVAILTTVSLGLWFLIIKDYTYASFCFSASGSVLAFFRYNVFSRQNKIFMGDTGSLIIGLVVTIFTIKFMESNLTESFGSIHQAAPAIAIGLLIVPLTDTLRVFSIRIARGVSPFKPDRFHLHHRLLDLGFNHRESAFMILGFNLLILILSISLRHLGNIRMLLITLPLSVVITSVPGVFIRYRERRFLGQLELFGDKSWILPITLINTILSRQARVGRHHQTLGRGKGPDPAGLPKGFPRLKDLEPILPDTYLRFNPEKEAEEPAEIENKD
jgi:hypothetical protein